ncbi:prolyl oligopeptidase family serine peptidase [Arthrobacter woluwensis]|uniref:prolyl oligopeptidase family serine peptidase n=1 Tax=Arthrobacter woluwensis TaxID=156980 RepID=UPI0037F96E6C
MNGIPGSVPGQERFRRLLRRWDASPRQGIPQLSGDVAVFLWRGRDDPQPTLHLASAPALRNAWDLRSGPPPETSPGRPLPAPEGLLVRGFTLAPDGSHVAALLSGVGEELARVWLLAPDRPARPLVGARSWHAVPVWTHGGERLWVLDGRPGAQRLVGWLLRDADDGTSPSAPPSVVPFPHGLAGDLPGRRLSLGADGEALTLRSRAPGRPEQRWTHDGGAWVPLDFTDAAGGPGSAAQPPVPSRPGAEPASTRMRRSMRRSMRAAERPDIEQPGSEQPGSERELARLATAAGNLRAVERDGVTTVDLEGSELVRLGPAERLQELSVSRTAAGDPPDGTLWIRTASPERPSAVVCLPLPHRPGEPSLDAPLEPPLQAPIGPPGAARARPHRTGSPEDIVHRRLLATADDGTSIPLIASVRADALGPDGLPRSPAPLLLSCYGGFGVRHHPEAEPSVPAWLEAGGVHVAAQLRGGGELGPAWHEAGRGSGKTRTVRDLLDVARFLAAKGWTTPRRTVAVGASHGGFVVTAAALRDPSAFGGVIAVAPLLDIVDLDRHGLGGQWRHEFGADGEWPPEERAAASPLHVLRRTGRLDEAPALLCCVMGRDERVDNEAAREFVRLYRDRGGQAWLREEAGSGHGQRRASDVLDFSATVLAFARAVADRDA